MAGKRHLISSFGDGPRLLFCSPLDGAKVYADESTDVTTDPVLVTCEACKAAYARVDIGRTSGHYRRD